MPRNVWWTAPLHQKHTHLELLHGGGVGDGVALAQRAGVDAHVGQLPIASLLQLEGQGHQGPIPPTFQWQRLLFPVRILHAGRHGMRSSNTASHTGQKRKAQPSPIHQGSWLPQAFTSSLLSVRDNTRSGRYHKETSHYVLCMPQLTLNNQILSNILFNSFTSDMHA